MILFIITVLNKIYLICYGGCFLFVAIKISLKGIDGYNTLSLSVTIIYPSTDGCHLDVHIPVDEIMSSPEMQ